MSGAKRDVRSNNNCPIGAAPGRCSWVVMVAAIHEPRRSCRKVPAGGGLCGPGLCQKLTEKYLLPGPQHQPAGLVSGRARAPQCAVACSAPGSPQLASLVLGHQERRRVADSTPWLCRGGLHMKIPMAPRRAESGSRGVVFAQSLPSSAGAPIARRKRRLWSQHCAASAPSSQPSGLAFWLAGALPRRDVYCGQPPVRCGAIKPETTG